MFTNFEGVMIPYHFFRTWKLIPMRTTQMLVGYPLDQDFREFVKASKARRNKVDSLEAQTQSGRNLEE